MSTLEDLVLADQAKAFEDALKDEFDKYMKRVAGMNPDYYSRRKYGKWTIYNKEGYRVAWGLNEKEMKNYMKLLKKEE